MSRADVAILAAGKQAATPRPEPAWPDADLDCPTCGGADLYWSLTCHTYSIRNGEKRRWMACMPCDSAIEYTCAAETCDWAYTHGLNPRNPRAEANEQRRPPWLPEVLAFGEHGIALTRPGIPAVWERGDDD